MPTKKIFLIIIVALLGIGISYSVSSYFNSSKAKLEDANGYWTCSMHPQIHQDHSGSCPICHMPLIKVNSKGKSESTSSLEITEKQQEVLKSQTYVVQKKSVNFKIPVSGRVSGSGNVVFYVYESDLNEVKAGLRFEGRDQVSSETLISGVLVSVDSIVDPTSRTVRVVAEVRDQKRRLFSETTVSGNIIINKSNALIIPESAVLHTGRKDLVYVFEEVNKLSPRELIVGLKTDGFYEVLSGLQENEKINTGANFLIDSESKIRGVQE